MTARRIAIVPHTHWDREWYKSYQDFRLALVELIDALLPLLEGDASYPHFMLDGQMAVVDDYLEVRPEAEGRLRALAAAGRLSMGPWYILMDEFLASGETIVRNLQMGLVRGAAFGGVMELGYLPDMFGHIAQMPQLLRQFGITTLGYVVLVHDLSFIARREARTREFLFVVFGVMVIVVAVSTYAYAPVRRYIVKDLA